MDYRELKRDYRKWYAILWGKQEGKCVICASYRAIDAPKHTQLVVDHNHETHAARALLCQRCNQLVGSLESPHSSAALAYLAQHKDDPGYGSATDAHMTPSERSRKAWCDRRTR